MPVQTVRTPYIHTGTYLYLFTLLPACDHERPSERRAGRGPFCACHAPKVRASAGSLSSPSFVRRDQRVKSHTHLAAALVRHDDHAIPVDTIGFPRSESPDLCEASPALAPYYVHDYSGSILPAIRFLYQLPMPSHSQNSFPSQSPSRYAAGKRRPCHNWRGPHRRVSPSR